MALVSTAILLGNHLLPNNSHLWWILALLGWAVVLPPLLRRREFAADDYAMQFATGPGMILALVLMSATSDSNVANESITHPSARSRVQRLLRQLNLDSGAQ